MAIHNRNNIHKSSKSGKEALAKGKKRKIKIQQQRDNNNKKYK